MKMSSFEGIVKNSNENLYSLRGNGINEEILDSMNADVPIVQETAEPENMGIAQNDLSILDAKIDIDKMIPTECGQLTKKSKRRKRHYNINKNKKWNKTYKRQKMSNTIKADVESVSQNNRKHMYTKVPKIIFNNKQAMHRGSGLSKFFLPDKRPRDIIVPPTKFLLGGNISDPLNLNSLQDEALVSISAVTPKSSPIPTPPKVEVIIPPNIYDPLHLLDPVDSIEYEKQLVSPIKNRRLNRQRSRKKRIRKIDGNEATVNADVVPSDILNASFSPKEVDLVSESEETTIEQPAANVHIEDVASVEEKMKSNKDVLAGTSTTTRKRKSSECMGIPNSAHGSGNITKKLRRFDSKDKIVSPVIPQPGAWKRPPKVQLGAPRNRNRTTSSSDTDIMEETNTKKTTESSEEAKIDYMAATKNDNVTFDYDLEFQAAPNDAAKSKTSNRTTDFESESTKYQFGNFSSEYSGLKTLLSFSDVRLTVFLRHAYLFKDKDILDIGCNAGHMTIAVARKLHPKSVLGIDIDKNLISQARKNLTHFQRIPESERGIKSKSNEGTNETIHTNLLPEKRRLKNQSRTKEREKQDSNQTVYFPISFSKCFGSLPIINHKPESPWSSPASNSLMKGNSESLYKDFKDSSAPAAAAPPPNVESDSSHHSVNEDGNKNPWLFPENVSFRTFNYAVTDETQMVSDKQQYDLILCLSLTKWIHLNFGDIGLKMTFRRMFNQLRPGGKLILEAQNWASYKKRKKLTPNIFNNYKDIEFFPNNFHEYLLSPEVGFSHSYTLGAPRHARRGFYRPIQLYIKGDFTPSQIRWSDTYHPQTPYEPMIRYAHYMDPKRVNIPYNSQYKFNKRKNVYKTCDMPFATSRYYNPLETDSYLPSYDNIVHTRHYCFASPLYSNVWSPPTSGRRSASQTPLFGSIRRVDSNDQDIGTKHVYLTPRSLDGGGSSRSNDEIASPQRSVRESDLDANTSSPKQHLYAFQ